MHSQVFEHLPYQNGISHDARELRAKGCRDLNSFAEHVSDIWELRYDSSVEVGWLGAHRMTAYQRQQLSCQVRGASRVGYDALKPFEHFGRRGFRGDVVCVRFNNAYQMTKIVSNAAGNLGCDFCLLRMQLLPLEFALGGDVMGQHEPRFRAVIYQILSGNFH